MLCGHTQSFSGLCRKRIIAPCLEVSVQRPWTEQAAELKVNHWYAVWRVGVGHVFTPLRINSDFSTLELALVYFKSVLVREKGKALKTRKKWLESR